MRAQHRPEKQAELIVVGVRDSLISGSKDGKDWRDALNPYTGQKTSEERKKREEEAAKPKPTAEERKRDNCERRVATARRFCKRVEEIPTVTECLVDDWTEYCDNFQVFVSYDMRPVKDIYKTYYKPKNESKWNLAAVTRGIKKVADGLDGVTAYIHHPKKRYERTVWNRNRALGYDEPYTDVDLWVA